MTTADIKQIEMANKVLKMIGRPEVKAEEITITDGGAIIVEIGKPDIDKLVKKALSL